MERNFFLDEKTGKTLQEQVYQAIKNEIMKQTLIEGEKLPSIRTLSKSLHISKNTVENAYYQLLAEGYIYSVAKSGYYVMDNAVKELEEYQEIQNSYKAHKKKSEEIEIDEKKQEMLIYDFKEEYVEKGNFNAGYWKKALTKVMNDQDDFLFSKASKYGEKNLKEQIATHFARVRGLKCCSEQIIISAGTKNLLEGLYYTLEEEYQQFLVEDPGFNLAKAVFQRFDMKVLPISLNRGTIDIEKVEKYSHSLCFCSPSYQFPTGNIMPIHDRIRLLNWAYHSDSYIIEDDYNSEIRQNGKPIPSLQNMDVHERVIYLGAFSTILSPAIRISFLVLPKHLVGKYRKKNEIYEQSASKTEQLALANMMDTGDYNKHIRKLRRNYRSKTEYMLQCIEDELGEYGKVLYKNVGLILVFHLKRAIDISIMEERLEEHKVSIDYLQNFTIIKEKGLEKNLILHYRGIKKEKILVGLRKLKKVMIETYERM